MAAAEQEHYPVRSGPLGGRYVIAKLGTQRKAREYMVQATSDDRIIVSEGYGSKGTIGTFAVDAGNIAAGKPNGLLTFDGAHFPHLALARPFEFPRGFIAACLEACQPLDSETTQGGVTVMHTVQVIGGAR
jgi:hypothetical protein